jgi:hypothetical protein
MFCAPKLVFDDTDGVGSHFHVLRSQTHFRQCGGCRVPFSSFVLLDLFSAIPRASKPVFMFCALVIVFSCTEGIGSRFHVLHSRTHFRRNRRRQLPFSCFAFPGSFSGVRWAPRLIFCGVDGVGSFFHFLRSRNHFWRFRGCRVSF